METYLQQHVSEIEFFMIFLQAEGDKYKTDNFTDSIYIRFETCLVLFVFNKMCLRDNFGRRILFSTLNKNVS